MDSGGREETGCNFYGGMKNEKEVDWFTLSCGVAEELGQQMVRGSFVKAGNCSAFLKSVFHPI